MPQFTQWNVPSPFPNVLYNPMAVDKAIAEIGHLDVERQRLDLDRDKIARDQVAGAAWLKSGETPTTDGTAPAGGGGGGTYAPGTPFTPKMLPPGVSLDEDAMVRTIAGEAGNEPLTGQIAVAHVIANRAKGANVSPRDVVFAPNQFEPWNGGAARARLEAMQPFDPAYQAILNNVVRPALSGKAADPTGGATHFYAPVAQRQLGREPPSWGRGTPSAVIGGHNFYSLGYGPGQARTASAPASAPPAVEAAAAPPEYNPAAGPRVGSVPPATAPGIVPPAPIGTTQTGHQIPPPTTAQIPPPVRAAAQALLAMPEPEAAVAYGPIIQELQAQGLAQNAPPEYPGHEAVAALVGGGETQVAEAPPDVAPSRQAMRLGGTAAAGPGAGQTTLPPIEAPNQMYQTGIPGITLNLPGSGRLAPPPVVTAAAPPSPGAASGGAATRPPVLTPQPAPSRVIQRDPLMQSGPGKGLTRAQFEAAGGMLSGGMPFAQVMTHVESWRQANIAGRQQDAQQAAIEADANYRRQEDYRKAQDEAVTRAETRADKAEAQRIAAANEKRAADKEARDIAKAEEEKKARIKGDAIAAQHENTLLEGTDSGETNTSKYAAAYSGLAAGRYNADGSFVKPNMSAFAKPTFIPPGATEVPDYGKQDTPGPLPPAAIMTGMQGNVSGIKNINQVLRELDTHPNSVGMKALQGEWALQYTDPEGVALRAGIADILSQTFHDRSGASVTISESPRLKPFVPSATDTVAALRTKLERLRSIYREVLEDNYSVYGPEGTGRSLPVVERILKQTAKAPDATGAKEKPPPPGSKVIIP